MGSPQDRVQSHDGDFGRCKPWVAMSKTMA